MNGRSMQDINARKMRETSLRREVNRSSDNLVCGIFSLIVRWSSCSLRCSSWKQANQAAGSLCLLHTFCSTFSKLLFVRINCRANTSFGTFASRDFAKVLNNKVSIFVEDHQ